MRRETCSLLPVRTSYSRDKSSQRCMKESEPSRILGLKHDLPFPAPHHVLLQNSLFQQMRLHTFSAKEQKSSLTTSISFLIYFLISVPPGAWNSSVWAEFIIRSSQEGLFQHVFLSCSPLCCNVHMLLFWRDRFTAWSFKSSGREPQASIWNIFCKKYSEQRGRRTSTSCEGVQTSALSSDCF